MLEKQAPAPAHRRLLCEAVLQAGDPGCRSGCDTEDCTQELDDARAAVAHGNDDSSSHQICGLPPRPCLVLNAGRFRC